MLFEGHSWLKLFIKYEYIYIENDSLFQFDFNTICFSFVVYLAVSEFNSSFFYFYYFDLRTNQAN
jgi:hypothetical protein